MRTHPLRMALALAGSAFLALFLQGCARDPESDGARNAGSYQPGSYLFCFWNVENLFDDHLDQRNKVDTLYDRWFAENPRVRQEKYSHLSQALLKMNDGRGPDILALAEVESVRAAELLRDALNESLPTGVPPYSHILMKEVNAGRHIAPAILTRLPVQGDRTRLLGRSLRILEGHVTVNEHDLVILASHWTSRLTDKDGSHRCKYGDQLYGRFLGMYKANPQVDLLICGDFNDGPDARSVTECLHGTGRVEEFRGAGDRERPLLLDLFASPLFRAQSEVPGTEYDRGRWTIFDQILVSPALVDDTGWTCDPASATIFVGDLVRRTRRGVQPWRFGNPRQEGPRGYSDHLPVTVRLKVAGS